MIEHTTDPLIFNTQINKAKYDETVIPRATSCPFCDVPNLTNILKTDGEKIWLKNKYPTIEESLMTVIIESATHDGDIFSYSREENRAVFEFAFDCWREMLDSKEYRSVLMFKNFGPRSGGTLRHPHMQIVGLEGTDGYEHISQENFDGLNVIMRDNVELNISTRPIMGFTEFNVIISSRNGIDAMADVTQTVVKYLLGAYMNGRCDSYNLFFYRMDEEKYVCKVVPRFISSPYFIGYKLPEVNAENHLIETAEDLRKLLSDI